MIERLTASAGSGKTHQLTRRFTELLLGASDAAWIPACGQLSPEGYDAAGIMAITFTNKAAAEMRDRVLAALKRAALGLAGDAPEVRRKAALELTRTLRHSQRLNIRTIDSLLARVARLFALELGLAPDFETVFGREEYFEPLFDRLAGAIQAGDAGRRTLLARAADALLVTENRPGFWVLDRLKSRLADVLDHILSQPESRTAPPAEASDLLAAMNREKAGLALQAEAMASLIEAENLPAMANFAKFLDSCRLAAQGAPVKDSAYGKKEALSECLLKAGREKASPRAERAYADFRAAYLGCLRRLPVLADAAAFAPFTALARELAAMFDDFLRQRGALPAILWPAKVKRLLSAENGAPDAWCRLGAALRCLLIDEFQDTSRAQWEALEVLAAECLSQGGGLFYVGDVKQAIYGWRGGDADLFEQAPELSGLTRMAPLVKSRLPYNWRSAPVVVDFNNRFFGALGGPAADEAALALLSKAPVSEAVRLADKIRLVFGDAAQGPPPERPRPAPEQAGLATLRALPGDTADEFQENVRQACLELLTEILCRREPGEAAILTRSNVQAAQVSSWLIEAGLPVVTENSLRLADHPLISQLLAMLAFLDYPPDNQAFWRFVSGAELFGRIAGLSRTALTDWLGGLAPGRPLYAAFREDHPEVWSRLVRPFFRQAGLTNPYDLAWEILIAYRVFERHPGDETFLRRFLETLHLAEKNGLVSLSSFLDFWKRKGGEEKAPQPENVPAVRVMTIHKSKGLEFQAVILPFLNFRAGADEGLEAVDIDGRRALVPLRPELGEPYRRRVRANRLEQLNLLYVAMTRAASELHMFLPGSEKIREKTPLLRAVNAVLDALGLTPGLEPLTFGRPVPARPVRPVPVETPFAPSVPEAAPETPIPPPMSWLPRLKVYRNSVRDMRQSLAFNEKTRGTLAHAAAQALRLQLADGLEVPEALSRAADLALASAPLSRALTAELRATILDRLAWLVSLPGMPDVLRRGLAEREILDAEGGRHRPDLMVLDPDEILILDYKTGAPDPEHERQMRRYLGLAAAMDGPRRPVRGALVYLDRKFLAPVREAP